MYLFCAEDLQVGVDMHTATDTSLKSSPNSWLLLVARTHAPHNVTRHQRPSKEVRSSKKGKEMLSVTAPTSSESEFIFRIRIRLLNLQKMFIKKKKASLKKHWCLRLGFC